LGLAGALFPHFADAWILHADEDLLVVDKPDGVASQAADPELPDDLVTRLKAHLGVPYLGVHQRLDRDTSGVMVLALRREANGGLAAEFEGRSVEKRYVACVTGWRKGRAIATLRDVLVEGDAGRMRVIGARGKGQLAVTQVKVLARQGERAMLELVLETGRMHQARVQLAHAGAPIAGDVLYGGAAAPRLMLHARSIALRHPTRGARVTFEASVPLELETWLERGDLGDAIFDDASLLKRALARATRRRYALGRSAGARETNAFRLVNEEGDGLPRIAVDLYGEHLVAQLYGDDGPWRDRSRRERVLDALHALGARGVYLKVRPKQANVVVDTRRDDLAPSTPVRGEAAPSEFPILEEGAPYGVRLGDGLSTGIFLDQRANRRKVRALAGGLSVANLFSYTCAFSVAAALGGATKTVSVDVAVPALEWGRENLRRAGVLEKGEHTFVARDVFDWMKRTGAKGEKFDLVILDPPSYSTTKRTRFSAGTDYAALAADALVLLRPGGRLLACSNHRGIRQDRFRKMLFDATRLAKVEAAQIKDMPTPSDFPVAVGGESHLKSALVTLRG
jgi:23S rRNA (cytosine1962-C5)-methyltransferase